MTGPESAALEALRFSNALSALTAAAAEFGAGSGAMVLVHVSLPGEPGVALKAPVELPAALVSVLSADVGHMTAWLRRESGEPASGRESGRPRLSLVQGGGSS